MEFNATFLISVISFVVFVIIMNLIFYKPIEKIVHEREKFMEENFDEAKKNNANSQKITEMYSKKIEETNSQCKAVLNEKVEKAKKKRDKLIEDAQNQTAEEIKNSQNELAQDFNSSKESLKSEIANLTNQMAQKIFGEKVKLNNIDENLINQIMDKG